MCRSVYPQHVCIYVNTGLYAERGTSSPLLWYRCTFQDVYVCWHTAVVPSWDNAGAAGCGLIVSASKCVHSTREVNPHYLFNLTRRQVFWTSRRQRRSLQCVLPTHTTPLFFPCCDCAETDLPWHWSFSGLFFSLVCVCFLSFFFLCAAAAASAAPRGNRLVSACTRRGQGKDWICQSASTLRRPRTSALCLCPGPCHTPTH